MRAEHADRLARLDEQSLVLLEPLQRRDDPVEALPVAGRPADAAIDDQLLRRLGDAGIEIVLKHADGRLGRPAPGDDLRSGAGADRTAVVASRQHYRPLPRSP
jgi:hypothetical protein